MADSPTIASDIAAGVKVDHRPWPGTKPGLRITREQMAKKIREGMHTPSVRALAGQILRDAGFPTTIRAKAEALRSYVKKNVGYAPDPIFSEMVVAAPVTLCLDDGIMCMPIGDCDDATVACQSLIGAAGMDARFFHIDYGSGVQTHMMGAVRDETGKWLEVDATTDRPVGYETSCTRKVLVDPFDDKTFDLMGAAGGSFIGVGKAFVGAGKAWDALPMHGYASAILGRSVGAGAALPTLQPCYQFVLYIDLQGATADDLVASFPWTSSVQNLAVNTNETPNSVSGTWIGSSPLAVPASIPVAHDFGGNTGYQTVQVLVQSGIIGARDTSGACAPIQIHLPPGHTSGGNTGGAPIHTGSTYHGGTATGGTGGTQSSTGLSTGAKVGLTLGAVALLGGGAFAAYKAGWFGRAA
ncbi:MAG TPA: hypothetical protein VNV25_25595 [Gemmatimonadaceae bacterium]|nr:hypothetical protein [Gemmatimonadaceae bacterium]